MANCGGCTRVPQHTESDGTPSKPITAVRYGKMGFLGEFTYPQNMEMACGAKVVVATERGIELGTQIPLTCHGCDISVSLEQMREYAKASSGDDHYLPKTGRILRQATDADLADIRHINETTGEKLKVCQAFAEDLDLKMKIVECEQILGGERIVFFFMAEERVDFRQLVRQLADEFQTRIEMRQVGARDEARLLADYETCGRQCCCKNFLKTLKPVTMSMAKLQKTTLDLAKVSGRCGRLKCCLRYEHATYEELNKQLPRNNSWVSTTEGVGKVIDRQVLTQLVRVRPQEGPPFVVSVEDILERNLPTPPPPQEQEERGGRGDRRPSARNGRGSRNGKNGKGDRNGKSGRPGTSTPEAAPASQPDEAAETKPPRTPKDEKAAEPQGTDGTKRSSRRRRGRRGRRRSKERRQQPERPNDGNSKPGDGQ